MMACDCGHAPTPTPGGCGTGYGRMADGRTLCYDCCTAEDRARIGRGEPIDAYLSEDGSSITNWPGRSLLRVVLERYVDCGGFCGGRKRATLRAVDHVGREWYGTGAGRGMYCRLRLSKSLRTRT